MKLSIDLDSIEIGEWNDTVSGIIRDELKSEIRIEVRKAIRANPDFKKAIKKMQEAAASGLLDQIK